MALDDYIEPEIGVAVAVTAAIMSPKVRGVLRQGAVYGLAGVLMAGDAVTALAQGVKRGVTANAAPAMTEPPASTDMPAPVAADASVTPDVDAAKATPRTRSARAKSGSETGEDTHE